MILIPKHDIYLNDKNKIMAKKGKSYVFKRSDIGGFYNIQLEGKKEIVLTADFVKRNFYIPPTVAICKKHFFFEKLEIQFEQGEIFRIEKENEKFYTLRAPVWNEETEEWALAPVTFRKNNAQMSPEDIERYPFLFSDYFDIKIMKPSMPEEEPAHD